LLPLRGNRKQEFGLWVAGATHVGNLLPRSGNKKRESAKRAASDRTALRERDRTRRREKDDTSKGGATQAMRRAPRHTG
jgi:hypothetical protein